MSLLLLWHMPNPRHDKNNVPNVVQARREPLPMEDDDDLLLLWWMINTEDKWQVN